MSHPAHKRARHVTSMPKSIPTQGRIRPNRVDARYLRRLTDEVCRRYHQVMKLVATDEQVERYVQTRALLEEEIERYRRQDENGRAAEQTTDTGHGPEESEATPKVAEADAAGNSGRNVGPYVLEVGSPGGTVARYRYADFDAMLADVERVAEKHRGPMALGNEDRADVDSDGLSDDEVERLEELL